MGDTTSQKMAGGIFMFRGCDIATGRIPMNRIREDPI
jgi:hypothetical protein